MWYGIVADVIVAVHLAYVSYVVLGELLILVGIPLGWQWIRNLWFRLSHLVMILIVALEAVVGFECPLTTWETQLERAAGMNPNDRSFIGGLMDTMFFWTPADDSWIWMWIYGGAAALVVLTFIVAPPRRRRKVASAVQLPLPAHNVTASL